MSAPSAACSPKRISGEDPARPGGTDTLTKSRPALRYGRGRVDLFLASKAESTIPVTAVMPFLHQSADVLITVEGSGITSLKDVGGRTVATSPFTSNFQPSHKNWRWVLKNSGVDPNVEADQADPSTLGGMLASGQVDAVINWMTSAPAVKPMVTAAGKKMVVIEWISAPATRPIRRPSSPPTSRWPIRPDSCAGSFKVYRRPPLVMLADPQGAARECEGHGAGRPTSSAQGQIAAAAPLIMNG